MPSFFIAVSGACRRAKLRPDTAMNTGPCRFIPQQCKKSCGCPSTVEALHGALDLALAFAVLDHVALVVLGLALGKGDRKSTRLNSSHTVISYAVFCLKKKKSDHDRGC